MVDEQIPRVKGAEPDVVISDETNICVVEAKLFSDFGRDEGKGAQLDREWSQGRKKCEEYDQRLWLLTVTNHQAIPANTIKHQLKGVSDLDPTHVFWISWSDIGRFLLRITGESSAAWRRDILEVMTRIGVAPFLGFDQPVETASRWVKEGSLVWRYPITNR